MGITGNYVFPACVFAMVIVCFDAKAKGLSEEIARMAPGVRNIEAAETGSDGRAFGVPHRRRFPADRMRG